MSTSEKGSYFMKSVLSSGRLWRSSEPSPLSFLIAPPHPVICAGHKPPTLLLSASLFHAGRPNYSILLFCLFTVYFIYLLLCCLDLGIFSKALLVPTCYLYSWLKPPIAIMYLSQPLGRFPCCILAALLASLIWNRMLKFHLLLWFICSLGVFVIFQNQSFCSWISAAHGGPH